MNQPEGRGGAEGAKEGEARSTWESDPDIPQELNELSGRIIAAAIEVHRTLGPGWLEASYEKALAREFDLQGIPYERQKGVTLDYKGITIGEGRMDFVVDGKIIVELKSVEALAPVHRAQCVAYLRTTNLPLCLLNNFNCPTLKDGIRRLAYTRR